jgi:hypothetical protein
VDVRADLEGMEKLNSVPFWVSNPDPSVVQPVARRYNDYSTTAHSHVNNRDKCNAIGYMTLGCQ